jgi:hypothetical protein
MLHITATAARHGPAGYRTVVWRSHAHLSAASWSMEPCSTRMVPTGGERELRRSAEATADKTVLPLTLDYCPFPDGERHHSLVCSDGIERLFSWESRVHDWRDYAIHMIFVAQ